MTNRFLALLALTLCNLFSTPAFCWNGLEHMEVAAIAWEQLTPTAKIRAGRLLRLNPLYDSWIDNVVDADRDRVAFIKASKWADVIKRLSPYQPDGLSGSNGNRPSPDAKSRQNIGYKDTLQHKYWHFIDMPFSTDQTELHDPDTPNIETQINTFRDTLGAQSRVDDDVRSYDLVWLIHLVGDVHQPLHTAQRFTREHPEGDAGGNLVAR